MCFKMGIPIRGLLHDLSKYTWKELSIYKFYEGTRSPHEVARKELGYSPSWMAHKAKNKHHWEYWTDNNSDAEFKPVKIPYDYVIESFCDIVGASKAYNKENFKTHMPRDYFVNQKDKRLYHQRTKELLQILFDEYAKSNSEEEFFNKYRAIKEKIKSWYNSNKGEFYGK